ncbi:MAG: site-specific recombinase [Gemmatimonadaceae bacterium]|nr:site-specific recombinase [Gemmatimonadaceae bacterium]
MIDPAPSVLPTAESVLDRLARDAAVTPAMAAAAAAPLAELIAVLRPTRREGPEAAVARLDALVTILVQRPALAQALGARLRGLLLARMHRTLYGESGLLASQGFLSGLWSRLLGRLLPPAPDPDFLRDLVAELFDEPRDAAWLAAVPARTWAGLFAALEVDGPAFAEVRAHCRAECLEAMRLVSGRLAALGVEPAMLRVQPSLTRRESPFLAQADAVRRIIEADGRAGRDALEALLDECTAQVAAIRRRAHETGVAVSLVFVLARLEQHVERLRTLARMAVPDAAEPAEARHTRVIGFFVRVAGAESRRFRLGDLFEGTTALIARRITEHASRSGEHYITETRAEWVGMFRKAAGAGLLVGVMALLKMLSQALGMPPFWHALSNSLIYGGGFVVIHLLHLTIATKQPAITAASLAAALDRTRDPDGRLDAIAALSAQVSRTQFISILGNVAVGFVTALGIALMAGTFLDWHPVGEAKALRLMHDLHPWESLLLFHAAIAGVWLFLSGLISGYYDNQALFHRIPDRIRRLKWLRRVVGPRMVERIADRAEHDTGAVIGSFLFGCLLGSTATVGRLIGVPLDIRHVSFAAANLAYALTTLGPSVRPGEFAVAALGVALIGVVNLVVSFALALRVALRSRGLGPDDTRGLTRRVLRRFVAAPLDFVRPPR